MHHHHRHWQFILSFFFFFWRQKRISYGTTGNTWSNRDWRVRASFARESALKFKTRGIKDIENSIKFCRSKENSSISWSEEKADNSFYLCMEKNESKLFNFSYWVTTKLKLCRYENLCIFCWFSAILEWRRINLITLKGKI